MKSTFFKTAFCCVAAILLGGCTIVPAGQPTAVKLDGGIWRSADRGATFKQVNDVSATQGKVLSLNNADINALAFDPQEPSTMYAGSAANGVFYTNDGGNSWQQFKALRTGNISSIVVDRQNKCIVYAVSDNKLFKTDNCGRDWNNVYYHQKSQVLISALAVDPKSSSVVYLGTSAGEVLKSVDGGRQWLTAYRLAADKIMDIIVDPYESKIIYVGAAKKGLYKSINAGASWSSLGEGIKSYAGSQQYGKLIYDQATAGSLIFVSKFGMLKTTNGGESWKVIDLLPANKSTNILAVAINPKDSKEYYYVTATTLVKTLDDGIKWSSQQLPYGRLTTDIGINPTTPSLIYLATIKPKN